MTQQMTTDQHMQNAGVQDQEQVYEDYFGFEETKVWYFPDKRQYITYQVMNEGQKAKFQKKTNRDITLRRTTGDASVKVDPAEERHALLEASVTGWHVFRNGQPVPFSSGTPGSNFNQWLQNANPKLVESLEFDIRLANPWLQGDMTIEDIDKEMDRLRDLREQTVKREEGKEAS